MEKEKWSGLSLNFTSTHLPPLSFHHFFQTNQPSTQHNITSKQNKQQKMNTNLLLSSSLIIILIITCITRAKTADIPLNSFLTTLTPNKTWVSENNTFSLQFFQINTTTSSYTLSITYDTSTPIWSAPTVVSHGASCQLSSSGDLQLKDSNGKIVWNSNTSNLGVTHAKLDETGNFMLLGGKNDSNAVWSSFDHPVDTVVTSQNFTVGMVLSSGVYSFFVNKTGNMTLKWSNGGNDDVIYYSLGLNSSISGNLSANPWLMLNGGILKLYDSSLSVPVIEAYGSDYGDTGDFLQFLRFLRLDNDGNLRMYRVDKGSGVSVVKWTAVSDQCEVFGYCGNMGICSFNEMGPVCGCPSENFDPVDEGDSRKGCRLKKEIKDCPGSQTLLQMNHTKFLTYPPEQFYYMGSSPCQGNCLSGGSCVASTTLGDGSGQCYIKSSNFVSGYHSTAVPSTSFVKVCAPVLPNPPPSGDTREINRLKGWIIGLVILGTIILLLVLQGSIWWCCRRKSPKFGGLSNQYALLEYASGAPVQFSYRELHQSTRGFKEKLGEGGFGSVYKGVLANKTVSAVKQLEGIEQGEKQFRMEVATISSTHHLNLVRLIGFCSEGRHRLLVYEFMKNGSLDSFLFENLSSSGKFLSWENRFNIALGTAKGITYLHEECRDCIIHCDIKPENILLDDNYNAKVSDFGLAKLINPKDHRYRTLTSVRGTRGYLAPEWLANLSITSKSDVYSFGMVLLEIVSGRRNFEVSDNTNRKKFSIWAYDEFEKGNQSTIIDKRLGAEEVDMGQVTRAIRVSFWCIQEQPSQRPIMSKVVQMLEGIMEIGFPPPPKTSTDGSVSGASWNMNSFSARSTSAASVPVPLQSSSFQTPRNTSFLSEMNVEEPTSSFPAY